MTTQVTDAEIDAALKAEGIAVPEPAQPQVREAMRALKRLTYKLQNKSRHD